MLSKIDIFYNKLLQMKSAYPAGARQAKGKFSMSQILIQKGQAEW